MISSSIPTMLRLILTQGYAFNTNDHNRVYSFKVYNEDDSPFDASGYDAPIVEVFNDLGSSELLPITGSWTTQGLGVGTFSFTSTNNLSRIGSYYIMVQLVKPGTVIGTERRRITVFANIS